MEIHRNYISLKLFGECVNIKGVIFDRLTNTGKNNKFTVKTHILLALSLYKRKDMHGMAALCCVHYLPNCR